MGMAQIGRQRPTLSPQMLPPLGTPEERGGSKGMPKVDEPGPPASGRGRETSYGKERSERLGDGIAMERSPAAGKDQLSFRDCPQATRR